MYRGVGALVIRGAFFSAGNQFGYDGVKTAGKERGYQEGPVLHFAASIAAAFGAGTFCNPAHVVMARY